MEDNKQRPLLPGNENKGPRKGPRFNIYWVYGIIFVALIVLQFYSSNFTSSTETKSFVEFRDDYLYKGRVDHVNVVNNSEVEVFLTKQAPAQAQPDDKGPLGFSGDEKTPAFTFKIGSDEQFRDDMADALEKLPETVKTLFGSLGVCKWHVLQ